jgi:diaminohydroxyphosphoribosylaminopyrimidine deaminase/5-amino-6-(5-phosphoribosylamino)uracil reductase
MSSQHHQWMAKALQLARRGLYTTDPNPRVGCVLVKDGQLVGQGFHHRYGEPHAERMALADAGDKAKGSTAYVTLEPCCHTGKTPPCSEGLIEAGVVEVVVAMTDPNPLVAGKGIAQLRAAGINVIEDVLSTDARAINPGFFKRMAEQKPYVRLKLGMSLDARTAMASGESQWITGDAARRDVQKLRARSSCVLTGVSTVFVDDPSLNVRLTEQELDLAESPVRQPRPVVLDTHARMPLKAKLLGLGNSPIVIIGEGASADAVAALKESDATVHAVGLKNDRVDLEAALAVLASEQINEVLIESGPTLAGAFVQQQLVDELVIYMAPSLLGDQARGLMCLPGLDVLADREQWQWRDVRQVGNDLRLTLTR